MNLVVHKTTALKGKVTVPSSKSQSIRAIFFALLAKGESILTNILKSEDTDDAIRVCQGLGASITSVGDQLIIKSPGLPLQTSLLEMDSGNSGITTRFVMPLLGFRQNVLQPILLNCGEQMRARPIRSLVDALRSLGLKIQYLKKEGMLPVAISGALKGGEAEVEGVTSQYLSALLVALPCASGDSKLTVKNLHERPYLEMTLSWLRKQKIAFSHERNEKEDVFLIQGNQQYCPFKMMIPGDFSSASYLIAAGALMKGEIVLSGLDLQDPQGDKRIVAILQSMGADIVVDETHLTIRGGKALKSLKIDANDIPDLLPTLAVIGTVAEGKTEIRNVRQARIKETDRIHSMTEGLKRLGAKVEEYEDGMTVYQSKLQGAQVRGYGDHRTVMALSLAGMLAEGTTVVEDREAIDKTFPEFVVVMRELGGNIFVEG